MAEAPILDDGAAVPLRQALSVAVPPQQPEVLPSQQLLSGGTQNEAITRRSQPKRRDRGGEAPTLDGGAVVPLQQAFSVAAPPQQPLSVAVQ